MPPMTESDLWHAKAAISELAAKERMYRDTGQWRLMHDAYYDESHVRVSWFTGSGHDFVEASSHRVPVGEKWSSAVHLVGPTSVELEGDRAIADTGCTVNARRFAEGVEIDTVIFVRHRSMVERGRDGTWRLRSFRAIYERDAISTVVPGDTIKIDKARLAKYRPSYRFMSYLLELGGGTADNSLPGVDRPDLVDALIAEDRAWLHGATDWPNL
jgi:hypothetical protein